MEKIDKVISQNEKKIMRKKETSTFQQRKQRKRSTEKVWNKVSFPKLNTDCIS